MHATTPVPKILLLTRGETGNTMRLSDRTIAAIPENLLPVVRIGRSVRYRYSDVELLTERLARGEISIGPVNQ